MNVIYESDYGSDYLMHHGVKGQKWGVRRYQNKDGNLTAAGKNRYYTRMEKRSEKYQNKASKYEARAAQAQSNQDLKAARKYRKKEAKYLSKRLNNDDQLIAQAKYDSTMAQKRQRELDVGIHKAVQKGNTKALAKLQDKKAIVDARANNANTTIQKCVNTGRSVVINASKKSYSVATKETKRYVEGQNAVARSAVLAVATLASLSTGIIFVGNSATYVHGTKYKIKSN